MNFKLSKVQQLSLYEIVAKWSTKVKKRKTINFKT